MKIYLAICPQNALHPLNVLQLKLSDSKCLFQHFSIQQVRLYRVISIVQCCVSSQENEMRFGIIACELMVGCASNSRPRESVLLISSTLQHAFQSICLFVPSYPMSGESLSFLREGNTIVNSSLHLHYSHRTFMIKELQH